MEERLRKIEDEINKTLNSLDNIEPVESNPFFYTRLEAKIESIEVKQKPLFINIFSYNFLRPAFFVILIAVNLLSAYSIVRRTIYQSDEKEEILQTFAKEYSVSQTDYYF